MEGSLRLVEYSWVSRLHLWCYTEIQLEISDAGRIFIKKYVVLRSEQNWYQSMVFGLRYVLALVKIYLPRAGKIVGLRKGREYATYIETLKPQDVKVGCCLSSD